MSKSFIKERCFLCLNHLELNPKKMLREQLIASHDSLTVQKVIEKYTRIELEESIDNCEESSVCEYCCLHLEAIYEFTIVCNKSQETLHQLTSDAQLSIKEADATESVAPGSEIESQMQVHLTPPSPDTVTTLPHEENSSPPNSILMDDQTNDLSDNFDEPSSNPDCGSVAIKDNKKCKSKQISKGIYSCNLCPKRFSKKSNLANHASRFHMPGNKRYSCDICNGYLHSESALKNHIESVHLKLKSYICDVCNVGFSCFDKFNKHQILCQKYLYQCNECGKKFAYNNYLAQIKCPACPNGTDSMVFVREHKTIGKHKCHQCGKGFHEFDSLKKHIQCLHTSETPLLCPKCGKIFEDDHDFKFHIKKHDEVEKVQEEPQGTFRCHKCNKTFNEASEIKPHYEESHTVTKCFRKRDTSKYKYVCDACGRSFPLLSSLEKHVVVHTSSEDRKFHCEKCNSYFKRGEHLQNHVNGIHLKVSPYSCKYCPETFYTSSALSHHLKRHMVEQKYRCSYCPRKFRDESYLNRHLRQHTNEKTLQCALCKEKFVSYGNLYRHTKEECLEETEETVNLQDKTKSIVDKDKDFNSSSQATCQFYCDLCGKSFESKRLLELHLIIHKSKDRFSVKRKATQQSYQPVNILENYDDLDLLSITLPTNVLNDLFPIPSTSDVITIPFRKIRKEDPLF